MPNIEVEWSNDILINCIDEVKHKVKHFPTI